MSQWSDSEFEDPNSGCADEEDEEAGPGVMGRIITTFLRVKEKVKSPRHAEINAKESKVAEDSPRVQSPLAQEHNDAVGLLEGSPRTAGRRGSSRVGDGAQAPSSRFVKSAGGTPRGSNRFSLREGITHASPRDPLKDLGESIIDKLPGSHMNPYAVPASPTYDQNPYPYPIEEDQLSSPPPTGSSSGTRSAPPSPGIFSKLKKLMTIAIFKRGTGTENATSGIAGTAGEQESLMKGSPQSPIAEKTDFACEERWPSHSTTPPTRPPPVWKREPRQELVS